MDKWVGFRRTDRQTHGRMKEREEREERFAMERWTSESQSGRPGFCVGHLCGSSTRRDHNWRETRGVKVSDKAIASSRLGGTRRGRAYRMRSMMPCEKMSQRETPLRAGIGLFLSAKSQMIRTSETLQDKEWTKSQRKETAMQGQPRERRTRTARRRPSGRGS